MSTTCDLTHFITNSILMPTHGILSTITPKGTKNSLKNKGIMTFSLSRKINFSKTYFKVQLKPEANANF